MNDNLITEKSNIIGYFSTSQQVIFGKNKSGKIIYLVKPFDTRLPNILIPYGGKLKGKLIITFKISNDSLKNIQMNDIKIKYVYGEIINIIGQMDESNLLLTLQYIYKINRKNITLNILNNNYEKDIVRSLINKKIFSIDPIGCVDIDDAISFESFDTYNLVTIYIAQPICLLSEEFLIERMKTAFSTLYNNYNIFF